MSKYVVVVESPAKAKTIEKYLGKDYTVLASYGHVVDLVPKEGSVDPNNNFAMNYQATEKNKKHVDAIARALKKAEALYLATDPDREGEAISWHLKNLMVEKKLLKDKPAQRVVFHEITKKAILDAIAHPRDVSQDLVNAQQARRALDFLVGFNLSPLLWFKVRPGLSAGRVQSPALRLIVERELEIEAFQAREYWTISADSVFEKQPFQSRLIVLNGEKLEQFSIVNEADAKKAEAVLKKASKNKLTVTSVEQKERKRNPAAPFITSTLQQEAARKLGFTADRTMRIAQQLYEGIDIGEGATGLISYMRTDSVTLSQEAVGQIREFIQKHYDADQLPESPRVYQTKAKNAQEAHEAIRPTNVALLPDDLKSYLSEEQLKLYRLIWQRTVACQMISATIQTMSVTLSAGEKNQFRATGSIVADPGFLKVYEEGQDDQPKEEIGDKLLPPLKAGDIVDVSQFNLEQHFTEPPPRFTEASLVKALEEYGIGRPSTYASIISTLKNREYVIVDQKRFFPTDVARVVNRFLTQYFTQYVDYDFTANMENELDSVADGKMDWIPMLSHFWQPFIKLVTETKENVKKSDVTSEKTDEVCPKCGKPLLIRLGKRGRFYGCTGYPECDYTRGLDESENQHAKDEEALDRDCPDCGQKLVYKYGRYGKFIGCSGYPKCKHIESLTQPEESLVDCPECKQAKLIKRMSRYKKVFYGCKRYPDCKYALWNEPLKEPCPNCQWPILTIKTTKRRGTEKVCPQKDCGYTAPLSGESSESA